MAVETRGREGSSHPARVATVAALGVSLAAALLAVSDEWRVHGAWAEYDQSIAQPMLAVGNTAADASGARPPRAALVRALTLARAAERATNTDLRRPRIEAARRWLAVAMAGRPRWGEAQLALAYIEQLDHGSAAPQTRAAFKASYRYAPYLRAGAPWRIAHALDQWNTLDPNLKAAVVNEAAWYSYQTDDSYWNAMRLVVDTPIELPFMRARAWIERRALHDRSHPTAS